MASLTKVVAPRPLDSASLLTQVRRMRASGVRGKRSDGQVLEYSSEAVVSAHARCGLCVPAAVTVVEPCCPPTPVGEKPLAERGTQRCCGIQAGIPQLSGPPCCD